MLTRSMALRVLLADESSTIKKVFQLALQDYAVEVTAVAIGTDVLQVAEKIKPDIIFADVLLQKKNGYDVSREIKSHPLLNNTPVVLIWSGFMELDQQKLRACGANGHLEKPFDAKKLRASVQEHVPKTKTQSLSEYLTLPKMPAFEEKPPTRSAAIQLGGSLDIPIQPLYMPQEPTISAAPPTTHAWSMESFAPLKPIEESDDFMPVDLPAQPPKATERKSVQSQINQTNADQDSDGAEWVNRTLTRFKLPPEKAKEEESKIRYKIPEEKIDPNTVLTRIMDLPPIPDDNESLELEIEPNVRSAVAAHSVAQQKSQNLNNAAPSSAPPPVPQQTHIGEVSAPNLARPLSENELEKIIRAQSQEVIEKVVWQIVPEIATRVIEREIERLLKERQGRS